VLNEANDLSDVYFWEDVFNYGFKSTLEPLDLPVVIMAGGQGSRLKPITNIIPKPLIPIGDKPILEIIIDRFSSLGVKKFYLSVNYKHEMIRFYFDGVKDKNYELHYFIEPSPLGTGGSLHLLKGQIQSTFFVSNCDIIIDQNYHDIYDYHKNQKNELTIVAALRHMQIPYGTLESGNNGELLELKEKPELTFMINTGMYVLEPHLLEEIPVNTFFHITDLIEKVKQRKGRVGVFPVSEGAWMDIGEWKEYNKTIQKMGYNAIDL
jgi:NDP-sugar pyrophosphorylase family protein